MDRAAIEALADYLVSQGLAERLPGYGHATGMQVAEGVAAWLSSTLHTIDIDNETDP
jgi:hypothetical protein